MNRLFRWLITALMASAAIGLAILMAELPAAGLAEQVAERMPQSGVTHPVTAVLLNFRGYDTFLEMLVLLLAVLGVRVAAPLPAPAPQRQPSAVLEKFLKLLIPLLIVVAAYLLWLGAFAPGGAFQAGAVLGAAGVLMLLAERRPKSGLSASLVRLLLALGVVVFTLAGLILSIAGAGLLVYPPAYAGAIILLIEALATIAIAVTLIALFAGLAKTES